MRHKRALRGVIAICFANCGKCEGEIVFDFHAGMAEMEVNGVGWRRAIQRVLPFRNDGHVWKLNSGGTLPIRAKVGEWRKTIKQLM
jgi:hypothetical protein